MIKPLVLAILSSGLAFAQFQRDIVAWANAKDRITYDSNYSDVGTPSSRITVLFTQLNYRNDWLILAKECAEIYSRHINKVSCFAYPTARHLDVALPPKNKTICWSARYLIINGAIQKERHTPKQLKQFGCPEE